MNTAPGTCPQQPAHAALADDVPLRQLTQPLETLDLPRLDLPAAARAHLRDCADCRTALRTTLGDRLRLRRRLYCPTPDRFTTRSQGADDAAFDRHLAGCPLCAAQFRAVRAVLDPRPAWARLLGGNHSGERPQSALAPLIDLLHGSQRQGWLTPSGGVARGAHGADDTAGAPAAQETAWQPHLQALAAGEALELIGPNRVINVAWDTATGAPTLRLHGRGRQPIPDFRLEIYQGDHLVWAAASAAGQVILPADLAAELPDSADRDSTDALPPYEFVILTP
ncbi:MAG: hypothetical protein M3Z04_00860 [Chloroflexota bacterium]|nr:hypothetical protein [Chloroflexota bacterium]